MQNALTTASSPDRHVLLRQQLRPRHLISPVTSQVSPSTTWSGQPRQRPSRQADSPSGPLLALNPRPLIWTFFLAMEEKARKSRRQSNKASQRARGANVFSAGLAAPFLSFVLTTSSSSSLLSSSLLFSLSSPSPRRHINILYLLHLLTLPRQG